MGAGGGQRASVVHGLSPRPAGRVPVRRTRPQIHRTVRFHETMQRADQGLTPSLHPCPRSKLVPPSDTQPVPAADPLGSVPIMSVTKSPSGA